MPDAYSPFAGHGDLKYTIPNEFSQLSCLYAGYMGWNSQPRYPHDNRLNDFNPETIRKNTFKDLLEMYYDKKSPQIYTVFAWNEWSEGAVIEPNNKYGEELGYAIYKAKDNIINIINFLKNSNNKFEYGNNNFYIDITKTVIINCIEFTDNNLYIYIPGGFDFRDSLFTDPLPGVHKIIKFNNLNYDEYTEIKIKIN